MIATATRKLALNVVGEALRVIPLRALSLAAPRGVVGLCYHAVAEHQPPHLKHLFRAKSPAQFESDIEFLLAHFDLIDYGELCRSETRARGRRPKAIVTFDDGLADCYHTVRPLLLKYGVPAVFFVTTEFLDNRSLFYRHQISLCIERFLSLAGSVAADMCGELPHVLGGPPLRPDQVPSFLRSLTPADNLVLDAVCERLGVDVGGYLRNASPYLTSTQVRSLAADGFAIGAHGTNHSHLRGMNGQELRREVGTACAAVAELVRATEVPFAFPFNGVGVSRETLSCLRSTDPRVGLFFDSQMLSRDAEFVVNRIVVDGPPSSGARRTNLPAYLRIAYLREAVAVGHSWARKR